MNQNYKIMSIQEKREQLKAISIKAVELKENLLHECKNDKEIQQINALTVNEIIIENFYKNKNNQIFKTYRQWQEEGKQVKKGEKAFLVWGKPRNINPEDEQESEEDEKETFYPVSYLFSNNQVRTL